MITIAKDASNWMDVFNANTEVGTEFSFESVADTTFVLIEYNAAHSLYRGSKTQAKIARKDNGDIVKGTTDSLKAKYCPDLVKGTHSTRGTRKFEVKNLECATYLELTDLKDKIEMLLDKCYNEMVLTKIDELERAKATLESLGMDTADMDNKIEELRGSLR